MFIKTYFHALFKLKFKVQFAVLIFSHDILSDEMRKHVSQAAALGCQGNISGNGVCSVKACTNICIKGNTTFKGEEIELNI